MGVLRSAQGTNISALPRACRLFLTDFPFRTPASSLAVTDAALLLSHEIYFEIVTGLQLSFSSQVGLDCLYFHQLQF